MKCMCYFKKRNEKKEVIEIGCGMEAVKVCRHGFWTCKKCVHGCKNENAKENLNEKGGKK